MINNESDYILALDLINEEASEQFAAQLACCIKAPLVIALEGEIGAGKTTIVRAMLKKLGVKCSIKSPTFSLVESYSLPALDIHHFDLYRIHHEDELEYLGFREYFSKQSVCCIEWAEHAGRALPAIDICLKLSMNGAGRLMQIIALSAAGKTILASVAGGL